MGRTRCSGEASSTQSAETTTAAPTVTTSSSSSPHPHGCSDADFIGSVVDVPSAEVCAQGCSDYTEPPWLCSTTLSPVGCQHSVWKPSGECRLYRTACSGESSKTSGWYAAGAVKSCDDACAAQGLFCNEADLHAHNNEVDSSAELLALIKKAGGAINASECKGNYGENTGVPNFSPQTNLCFFSSASRSPSKFDCAKKPWPASRTAPPQNQVQVTGVIEVTVNEPDIILNDPEAKIAFEDAMAAEIASTLGLRSSAVTVTASKDDSGRRLMRGRRLANDGLLLTYVINALA